ncbi:VOC family protein [Bradyrhizobium neotropicale]|uniref:VOC domain-containing protein n=1 Tax=Bradyrhizobium neotropicale TaxID=1497615 RepID=A0A176ZG33_9BRAD|nr:VOC family protein [Bradyrhizobium neotropicale]OAF19174.1 hypothetical protein AXW67_37540 [Bradyrhizobium neotropicale]
MSFLVQKLGYVSLGVKDLARAVEDSVRIAGVRVTEKSGKRALLTSNRRRAELVLHEAPDNGFAGLGLEAVNPDTIDEAKKRAIAAGLRIISDKPLLELVEKAVSFQTSAGHVIEIHTPVPSNLPVRYSGPGVHPSFLDHVTLATVDAEKTAEELQQVLGMRLSERDVGNNMFFLRGADGRHHTVGLFRQEKSGLHHYSWEFADFSDFKRLGDVIDVEGRSLIWGPGRHGAGDNIFTYHFDSAGFIVECTSDMAIIHEENFTPRICDFTNPKAGNLWCAMPPPAEWVAHCSPNIRA